MIILTLESGLSKCTHNVINRLIIFDLREQVKLRVIQADGLAPSRWLILEGLKLESLNFRMKLLTVRVL